MPGPLKQLRSSGFVLELVVFGCGAIVMVYEIIGSRIVAPFIGASTYVWTSLIGVILGALSVGYWLGGRLADQRPDTKILAGLIFGAGGLISVTILLKDVVLSFVSSASIGLGWRSVLAALFLFAPASVALGMVTPFAVKLRTLSLADTGRTVGRLYAVSTVGSIVGTFAAGFFLIPFVGSVRTLYLIAGCLFLLSVTLVSFTPSRQNIAIIALFLLGVTGSELGSYAVSRANSLTDIDTEYSRVMIFQSKDPATARPIRVITVDPYFVQSAIFLDSDDLVFRYNHYYHLLRHFRPGFQKTLMIGGAGYTFPREYLRTYPNSSIDVVEIDPGMTQIARGHFRLKDDPRMRIIHSDGRVFLDQAEGGIYDAVLMDAFGSLFSVPYQLTTVEAVRRIDRTLKPGGIVILNLGSAISGSGSMFLRAELKTFKEVFPVVRIFKVRPEYRDDELQNIILVACKTECSSNASGDPEIAALLQTEYRSEIPLDVPVLTDDLAPVEYYNSFALDLYQKSR